MKSNTRRTDTHDRLLSAVTTTVAHLRSQVESLGRHRAANPDADRDPSFMFAESSLLRALAQAIDQARIIRDA